MSENPRFGRQDIRPYDLFMIVLCVWALGVLAVGAFTRWNDSVGEVLGYADNVVCVFFLMDFFISLYRAPRRMHYLVTWGWIDLLSSIPALDAFRWGRTARVVRLLRVLRAFKSARLLTSFVVGRRAESAVLASALVVLLLIVSA